MIRFRRAWSPPGAPWWPESGFGGIRIEIAAAIADTGRAAER